MEIEKRKEVIEMIKQLSYYFDKCKDQLCEPYGLSSIQSKVIIDVYHHDGCRVTDICKRLNKETNTISPLITRLINHGYLIKEVCEDDRRVFYVHLTAKSQNIMSNLMTDVEKTTWPLFDKVSDAELNKIYESLQLLLKVTKEN